MFYATIGILNKKYAHRLKPNLSFLSPCILPTPVAYFRFCRTSICHFLTLYKHYSCLLYCSLFDTCIRLPPSPPYDSVFVDLHNCKIHGICEESLSSDKEFSYFATKFKAMQITHGNLFCFLDTPGTYPGFPVGGCAYYSRGANIKFCQISPKKLHGIEKILGCRGHAPGALP